MSSASLLRTTASEPPPAAESALASALVGRVLGNVRLDAAIGSGGMGVVMGGAHVVTGRAVAVKVLRPERTDQTMTKRFLREARVAASLDHPNVVSVLDCGETDEGLVYQVLELLEGETLRDRLARGPLPVDRTLAIVLPILHALEAAHTRGVVHRDLKPGNVFLARNKHGRVVPKLLDFGIAKLREPLRGAISRDAALTPTTQSGTIIGTPAYMSPEQARGEPVTKASDLFSMGAVLFECLTGEVPFDGVNPNVVMARIVLERARRADEVAPTVPRAIADVIESALAPQPSERPPGAAALASLLRAAAAASGVATPNEGIADVPEEDPDLATTLVHPPSRTDRARPMVETRAPTIDAMAAPSPSRPRSRASLAIGLAVALASIGALVAWALRTEDPPPVPDSASVAPPDSPPAAPLDGIAHARTSPASTSPAPASPASTSPAPASPASTSPERAPSEIASPASPSRARAASSAPNAGAVVEPAVVTAPDPSAPRPSGSEEEAGLPELREW